MTQQALLHLLRLTSPALPVGAYAYSQGLEFALESGILDAQDALPEWLAGVLEFGLGRLDLPVLARLHAAWSSEDYERVRHWHEFVAAARETAELALEDEQLGLALNRLLRSFAVPSATKLAAPSYVTQFALAATHWQVPCEQAVYGFAYSWLENQVAAATKLVPLGQTQAQHHLVAMLPQVEHVCAQAMQLEDVDLGFSLPGLAMASAGHERQYSRLFRS